MVNPLKLATDGTSSITYFEGTAIWMENENAVRTIFPHGKLVRKHVVFQKRLKKSPAAGS